jgi:hypothetical protein
MARVKVTLDHAGIAEVLKSGEVHAVISAAAGLVAARVQTAATVQRHGAPVWVLDTTTDRAKSLVTIAHAGGLGMQARYGVLTQAAGDAGLEVTEK